MSQDPYQLCGPPGIRDRGLGPQQVPPDAGDAKLVDFELQVAAMIEAGFLRLTLAVGASFCSYSIRYLK